MSPSMKMKFTIRRRRRRWSPCVHKSRCCSKREARRALRAPGALQVCHGASCRTLTRAMLLSLLLPLGLNLLQLEGQEHASAGRNAHTT